jgi:hypothetical protein
MDEIKTPTVKDNPRSMMRSANVHFGECNDEKASMERKLRDVTISPIYNVKTEMKERKRQPLFGNNKMRQSSSSSSNDVEFPCVTPSSFSVTSNTTVTTHPLTVCSTGNSVDRMNTSTTPPTADWFSVADDPMHNITQDSTPYYSRGSSTTTSLAPNSMDSTIHQSAVKYSSSCIDTPSADDKFWSSFTPCKIMGNMKNNIDNNDEEKASCSGIGLLTPSSNSRFFQTLLENKGSSCKKKAA